MVRPFNAWYVRLSSRGQQPWEHVRCHIGDAFPDGHTVGEDDEEVPDDVPVLWETSTDAEGRLHIAVSRQAVPHAPPLWFVTLPGKVVPGEPRTHNLVAYDTDDLPPGTVVDGHTFFVMPVRSDQQVAAVQWDPEAGIVRQIYVKPDRRREDLATKLLYAASAFHQSHGWPGVLRSDGRRTDLGEQFTAGLRHPGRIAPWTEHSPPMDPPPGTRTQP